MATTNILPTFSDSSNIVVDVSRAIEILTARENYFVSNLQKVQATAMVHHYQTDTLAAAGSLVVEEGSDLSAAALTVPSRLTNVVQTSAKAFMVSDAQRAVEHFSGTDELARQTDKAIMELANSMEFDLVRNLSVAAASGATGECGGILSAISTALNYSAHSSGTTFAASILDAQIYNNWINSNGDTATDYFVGGFLRKVVDSFTQKTNNIVQVSSDTIENGITYYSTSFGVVKFHTHRYLNVNGDATGRVLGVRPDKLAVAYLTPPRVIQLAKTGISEKRAVTAAFTLEVRNQNSNTLYEGFDID
jgi:hypothetical protein